MAKPTKRPTKTRIDASGVATPVGGEAVRKLSADADGRPGLSTRYTPPVDHFEDMPSPRWVPVLMFALFALGMLTILLNYVELLPGGVNNWYLLAGLGFILGGIITATQYR